MKKLKTVDNLFIKIKMSSKHGTKAGFPAGLSRKLYLAHFTFALVYFSVQNGLNYTNIGKCLHVEVSESLLEINISNVVVFLDIRKCLLNTEIFESEAKLAQDIRKCLLANRTSKVCVFPSTFFGSSVARVPFGVFHS